MCKITEVQRLCTQCIETGGKIQPMFFYKDGELFSHNHSEESAVLTGREGK